MVSHGGRRVRGELVDSLAPRRERSRRGSPGDWCKHDAPIALGISLRTLRLSGKTNCHLCSRGCRSPDGKFDVLLENGVVRENTGSFQGLGADGCVPSREEREGQEEK